MQEIRESFLSESIYKYYELRFYLNLVSVLIIQRSFPYGWTGIKGFKTTTFVIHKVWLITSLEHNIFFLKNILNFSSVVKRKLVSQTSTFLRLMRFN